MRDDTAPSPQLLRGLQLKQLGRFPEAERAFREALAANPRDAFALHQLAAALFHQPERQKEALQTVREAIAIEPGEAEHFVLQSFILGALHRPKEALAAARAAIGLAPVASAGFAAQAQAHLQLEHWAEAERSARQALALDADHSLAANQLAQALRFQNRLAETSEHLAGMLARDPEDPFTHANAGWAALQRGEHRVAETHFREALRLDPDFDYARDGLLNSFRARSPVYRAYLRYCFWMQRLSAGSRWAVILGLYFGVKFVRAVFTGPYQFIGLAITVLYFVLVLWVWIARGFGNLFLLFDRFARHALRRSEKIEAIAVGGGVCLGAMLFALSLAAKWDALALLGAGLIAAAFPFSLTFTNDSRVGRVLFGTIGAAMLAATLLAFVSYFVAFLPGGVPVLGFIFTLIACLACTWLGNIPALRRG
jgi:tetratricopeptide (TPR) repeat protein